jgi:uncharacterized membrane protein YuzA (DUF378 family)
MQLLDRIAPSLAVAGGLNWALVGLANVDLVAKVLGSGTTLTHAAYALTGLATLYCLTRLSASPQASPAPSAL